VAREVEALRTGLGTRADVESFVESSLRAFGSTVRATGTGFTATLGTLPVGLRDAIPPDRIDPLPFQRDFPVGRHEALLHRSDLTTAAIAGYVLEAALDPTMPAELRPARRCAVVRTSAVSTRTTLLLVRYRFHLSLPSRSGERTLVAEDAALLAFEGGTSDPRWLEDEDVRRLLDARASGNVSPEQARSFISRVLDRVDDLTPHLDDHGDLLAERTVESHRRVRQAAGEIRRGLSVQVERPADVLGVYVYVPEVGA
jgi:hypothetical protein